MKFRRVAYLPGIVYALVQKLFHLKSSAEENHDEAI